MIFGFLLISVFLLGTALGSFTTAIVYRIHNRKSWIFSEGRTAARSKCARCDHLLNLYDLVPLLSWIYLKGRCRYCRGGISKQYILTELLSGLMALILFMMLGETYSFVVSALILPFALAQAILFYQNKFISFQLCGIITGILISFIAFKLYIML